MATTWKIKPGARWHDGAPLTTQDLVFTAAVEQDRELELAPYTEWELVDSIDAPDAQSITVNWKRTFIEADALFGYRSAGLPLPKHLLERAAAEDKLNFQALPYWSEEFVGAGPFRVQEWVRDSHSLLRANDSYALGRPKIDEIEVKFIPDNNTLIANVLAGIDMTLGKTVSLDIALPAREQWKDGSLQVRPQNWTPINPQFINPDPPIILDLRFRRALLEALDRQALADFVFSGYGSVAHSYVSPETPHYDLIEPSIVKYDFNVRQATQAIEGLGYTRRGDGFFYDGGGQKLAVELRIPLQNDIHAKTAAPIAERYRHPDVDAALERYAVSIPLTERAQALAALVHHQTENLSHLPIFFGADPTLISNRLVNVTAGSDSFTQAWNAHEWDIR